MTFTPAVAARKAASLPWSCSAGGTKEKLFRLAIAIYLPCRTTGLNPERAQAGRCDTHAFFLKKRGSPGGQNAAVLLLLPGGARA